MTKLFQLNSEDDMEKVVAQSQQIAQKALKEYDLDGEHIRFNQLSDTCTFVIETEKDGDYLLRIHANKNRNEIDSELAWLSYLHEKIELEIPTGIECRYGSKTVSIDLANGDCVFVSVILVLLNWTRIAAILESFTAICTKETLFFTTEILVRLILEDVGLVTIFMISPIPFWVYFLHKES